MGTVVRRDAAASVIAGDVRIAYRRAKKRGGEIGDVAEARLGPAVAAIDASEAILKGAVEAEEAAWEVVLARDYDADLVIGAQRDDIFNVIGRAARHPVMDHIYPGGFRIYTSGDPLQQPVLMQVLESRIRSLDSTLLTADKRAELLAALESVRVPFEAAVEAYRPLNAARTVAEASHRATIRTAHARLTAFKRDLKNLGLTEAQIHDIIPDRPSESRKATDAETDEQSEGGAES